MNAVNQNARPGEPGTGSSGERFLVSAPARRLQGVSDPLLAITGLWLVLDASARAEFIEDVRVSEPTLCAPLERTGGRHE